MFRYKRSVDLEYDRQGYIHFKSLLFHQLQPEEKQKILDLCYACGGDENERKAIFEFVTTHQTGTALCMKHYISKATLYRMVKKYYEHFPKD